MPAAITHLISKNLITLDLKAKDKNSAIEELARFMEGEDKLHSRTEFLEAVHEREALTTTAVGWGVAIPHARSPAVRKAAIAFGRSKGFRWDSNGEEIVKLVFLLAVPSINPNKEYIELLASLARMLVHEDFRDSLIEARDRDHIIAAIEKSSPGQ